MLINAPVYSDENGLPVVSIYSEDEDGSFRRVQGEPLRLFREDIAGISIPQGELVSGRYDRQERRWDTPTVTFHYGRPQSFYQFLRDNISRNRFFVFTKPMLSGHITKFAVHELQLKSSMSQRKLTLLKEKYTEALELWSAEEHERRVLEKQRRPARQTTGQQVETSGADHAKTSPGPKPPSPSPAQQQSPAENPRRNLKQRPNLVQSFSLNRQGHGQRSKSAPSKKEQNEHFFKRFIFTVD
jgi:hypothetical protein